MTDTELGSMRLAAIDLAIHREIEDQYDEGAGNAAVDLLLNAIDPMWISDDSRATDILCVIYQLAGLPMHRERLKSHYHEIMLDMMKEPA